MARVRRSSAPHTAIHRWREGPQTPNTARFATGSEQTELLPAALRPGEMIGRQFRSTLVQAELFAGDFKSPSDHPGHRPGSLHSRAPLRIVVAAAAHITDQREDVAI